MSEITLTAEYDTSFTLVPDAFIDRFLPEANGEYIKVYLYVLKALRCGSSVITSDIADALEKEESDILRALKYWDKKGVIGLQSSGKKVTGICIKKPGPAAGDHKEQVPYLPEEVKNKAFRSSHTLPTDEKPEDKPLPEDVTLLITAAEGYFNRTLTLTDRNIILYMYDDLGLSFELIDYLFCRAVETKKTQLRYVEKVALSLHENDIASVNDAIKYFGEGSDLVHTVMHAFGLQSRRPTTAEQKYISKWSDTFGFDKVLIEEACSRSSLNTNSGNFQYADKILTSWHKAGVGSLDDVKKLDEVHKANTTGTPAKKNKTARSTDFNSFEQRNDNIEELEKKILGGND